MKKRLLISPEKRPLDSCGKSKAGECSEEAVRIARGKLAVSFGEPPSSIQ